MPARELGPDPVTALDRLRALAATAATEDEARAVAAQLRAFARRARAARWEPYVWQRPHVHPAGWVSQADPRLGVCDARCADLPTAVPGVHGVWLQRSGRGCGKTEAAARYWNAHVEGPACDPRVPGGHRLTIVGPTQADTVSSCVTGVSGLQAVNPDITVSVTKEGTLVRWPNGALARVLGGNTAKDVQRARAWTNICGAWVEEAAAIPYLGGLGDQVVGEPGVLDQLPFTLRLGQHPHIAATTTPTGRREVTRLIERAEADGGVQTWGRTRDAHHLAPEVRAALEVTYPPGSTIARQELDGEQVGDVAGALFLQARTEATPATDDRPGIDNDRVPAGTVGWSPHTDVTTLRARSSDGQRILDALRLQLPARPETPDLTIERGAIGVDPAGGSTENGLVAVGLHAGHGYTLADLSLHGGPATWGMAAVLMWQHFGTEGIAVERTYGGDQTWHSIVTACAELGLPEPAPLRAPTVEGKKARAIPVQALAQVHRLHMVGRYPQLEGELCHPAGTLVLTRRGHVPIETITTDDFVMTRGGWAPLAWAGQTGTSTEIVSIIHDKGSLNCTPCHPVYLPSIREFVPASTVRPSDHLSVLPACLMPSHGEATGGPQCGKEPGTTEARAACSTEPSTSTITARSRLASSSTTATTTRTTTASTTCNPSPPSSTPNYTRTFVGERIGVLNKMRHRLGRWLTGGAPTKGTKSPARSAGTCFDHATCALSAAQSLSAVVSVQTVDTVSGTQPVPVYNLTVAAGHLPEFYADGVLVHNCTWVEDETPESPNRLDAWVHAHRHLLVRARTGTIASPATISSPPTTGVWGVRPR